MKNIILAFVACTLLAMVGGRDARGQCEGGICRPRADRVSIVHRERSHRSGDRQPVRSVSQCAASCDLLCDTIRP